MTQHDILTTHVQEQEYALSLLRAVFTEDSEQALAIKGGILRDDRYDRGRWLTHKELTVLKANHDKAMRGEPMTQEEASWRWPPRRPSEVF